MKDRIRSRFLSPDVLGVGALLLFVLLRFLPVVLLARLYAPFRDNVFIYGPMFSETARIALHGEYPFYLPSFGTGFPLFQSPHYSPAYPFYFFGLLDYGGPLRSLYVLTYLSILHRVILGLNFYVMLRCARLSPLASFLAAALGIFAYNTEVYAGWITISASYTWLPLAIAGGILLLRNHRRTLGIVLLGVGSGLLALASASQAIAHALLFFGIFFVAGLGWVWRRDGIFAVSRFALALVCAGLLALGIGGVSAIPVYLGLGEMIRHIGHGYVLGHDPIPWSRFNETQLALRDWTALFWNAGAVEVVGSPYIGPLGLAGLVLCGLGFGRLDSLGKFLALTGAAIGLYALGSAFGSNLGFSYLNYHLPFLSKIREAGRYLVLFVVAVVLLVGLGFDRLEQALKEPRGDRCSGRRLRFGAGLLLLIFIALTAGELVKNARVTSPGSMVLLLTPILLLWGLLLRTGKPVPFLIAALLVSFASLISPPRTFPLSGSEFTQKHNLDHLRVLSALRERLPAGDYRLDFVDAKTSPFTWGMNASYFGFNSFYNRLTPQPYDQYRFSVRLGSPLLHELMGARYVLSGAGETPRDPAAKRLFDLDNYTLYENPDLHERIYGDSLFGRELPERSGISRASEGGVRHAELTLCSPGRRLSPAALSQRSADTS